MGRRIALYGGSFNPPGLHHRELARIAAERFDRVVVVPCGPRPDKPTVDDIDPVHRAALVDLAFRGLERVEVDLFDFESESFTRTVDLPERYAQEGEIWLLVGSDLVRGGADGRAEIQGRWWRGESLWRDGRFLIVTRAGSDPIAADLPPRHELLRLDLEGASTEIRARAARGEPLDGLVTNDVAAYVRRWRLYRPEPSRRTARFSWDGHRALVHANPHKPSTRGLADELEADLGEADPTAVVVLGGDGTLIDAVRTHWRRRLPFLGWNYGRRGGLLNPRPQRESLEELAGEFVLHLVPLLAVEAVDRDGVVSRHLALNDAWIERRDGQAAWIELRIDGEVRRDRIVCDGVLVATPAGSSGYARAMGASAVPLDSHGLVLAVSNPADPEEWRGRVLDEDARVELRAVDPLRRPARAFVDGASIGEVETLRVWRSRAAAVELGLRSARTTSTPAEPSA